MRTTQRGFSVIEVLIAAAIFLIIALGLLPLFAQAMRSNVSGRDATSVSNLGKSRVEELLQVPFETLVVPVGQTVGITEEYWSTSAKAWKTGTPSPNDAAWFRTTRVRQFSLSDLLDNGVTDTPLPGETPTSQVQFKEIVIEIRGLARSPLAGGASLTLRRLRAV